jgi:PcfJ-like protein
MNGKRVAVTNAVPVATAGEVIRVEPSPNIVNIADVYAFGKTFAADAGRPEVEGWFCRQLPNFLLRDPRLSRRLAAAEIVALQREAALPDWAAAADAAGRPLHWFDPYQVERWDGGETDFVQALHVVREWLAALPESDRHLRRLGRVSVLEAIAAARGWRQQVAKRREHDCPEDWTGLETVWRSPLGPKFVRLTTPAALWREGTLMCNCLRHGWYKDEVAAGTSEIYSLRDTQNRPHVTIQVKDGFVVQVKGKQNATPPEKWLSYVHQFVASMNWHDGRSPTQALHFIYGGRAYTNVAGVIADLPQLVDLDAALFDSRLFTPVLHFITTMQRGVAALAAEFQQAIVALLCARITETGGYRLTPCSADALALPGSAIAEIRVELPGAIFALADRLPAAGDGIAALCREVLCNVLMLVERRPGMLYRLAVVTGAGAAAPQALAWFISTAGLANEFYRIRRVALDHKRRRMVDAVIELKHRLAERRSAIADAERAQAINLIRVQVPRFCERTLNDPLVA